MAQAQQIGFSADIMPEVAPPPKCAKPRYKRPSKAKAISIAFPLAVIAPAEHRAQLAQRPRRCLSCQTEFDSVGVGNRICGRCKNSDVFRTPADFSVAASF